MGEITSVVTQVFGDLFVAVLRGLPQFFAGLVILLVGLISASILMRAVQGVLGLLMIEKWAEKTKIAKSADVRLWEELLAQLVRWTVVILFLVPALETWGIPKVTEVLSVLLVYLPKVFVAVVVGFLGIVIANLSYDVVKHAAKGLGTYVNECGCGYFAVCHLIFYGIGCS